MTLPDTATTQELATIHYIKQLVSEDPTIKLAIDHQLIKVDYILSPSNLFITIHIYTDTPSPISLDRTSFPITTQKDIWPTMTDVKQNQQRKLKHVVSIARNMLDLEQAIISNYNNKLIEY